MTNEQENPHIFVAHREVNGIPRTVAVDTRNHVARQAELAGQTLTEEELTVKSLSLAADLQRIQRFLSTSTLAPTQRKGLAAIFPFIRKD